MRKIMMVFAVTFILMNSDSLFAADAKPSPRDTIFNRMSSFFSEFDKTYTRRGNKQGFWNAAGDWLRNINKE